MGLKGKLTITIISIIIIFLLLGLGIWSVTKTMSNIGGDVRFEATDVNATVVATFSGTKEEIGEKRVDFDSTTTEQNNVANWTNLKLDFADKNEDIVIRIVVTNNSFENGLIVTIEDSSTDLDNLLISVEKVVTNEEETRAPFTTEQLVASEIGVYEVTLHVINPSSRAQGKFALNLTLLNPTAE